MSKKVFATIFAAILAVSAFSGCGGNGGSSTPSSSTPFFHPRFFHPRFGKR